MKTIHANVAAVMLGVRDGYQQPYEVTTSANVEHLEDAGGTRVYEYQDIGINLGQFARARFRSEAWKRALFPFNLINQPQEN